MNVDIMGINMWLSVHTHINRHTYIYIHFEKGSHCVAQADLELTFSFSLLSVRTMGVYHIFFLKN